MTTYMVDDEEDDDSVVIDNVMTTEEYDGVLRVETHKLLKGEDPFLAVPWKVLDKNAKRRVKREETKLEKDFTGLTNSSMQTGGGTGQVNQGVVQTKYMASKNGARPKHLNPEQIYNAYFLWHLATPPYNLEYLTELSTTNPTHHSCIRAKATNIVGLGHTWQPTNKVKELRQDVDQDEDKSKRLGRKLSKVMEGLDELLEGFNSTEAFIDTMLKVWMDVEATGNGYLEVGRNRSGTIGYLGHIPGYSMRVRVDRDGFVQMLPSAMNKLIFFRNFGDRSTKDIFGNDPQPNEVIHFKKEHFKNAYYGIPDIISALTAIAGDKFSSEYNLEYFENKAVPRYALIIKGAKLSAASERKILEYFRKEVKGKHHGTLYIPVPATAGTNVDVKLEPIENQVQDMSFYNYREFNRQEIMMAHRVPGSQIGIEAQTNLSASRESSKVFKEQVCRPEQNRVEWKLNLIVKQFTDMFLLQLNELDLLDEETKSRIYDRYVRLGIYNANEVRAKLGEQPRTGGELYLDPTMKTTGDANLDLDGPGATPGPPRITTEGSPKNTSNGSVRTPADQTSYGRQSKLAAQERSGQAR